MFAERTAAEWLPMLRSAGVPASERVDLYNVSDSADEQPTTEDMVSSYAHPFLGKMKYSSNGLRFKNTEKVAGRRTPLYSADDLQALYDKGVIFTEDPSKTRPQSGAE